MVDELIQFQYRMLPECFPGTNDLANLQHQIDDLDQKLEQYAVHADRIDYAVAVASGILCGVLDSLFIGKIEFSKEDIGDAHKTVNQFVQNIAKKAGYEGERLNGAVEHLEKKYKVAQDDVWKGKGIGVSAKNHHLADLAHHPTPLGLASAIAVQFLRFGTFVNKNGEWHFVFVETHAKDIVESWGPVIITGILQWMINLVEEHSQEDQGEELPEYIHKLIRLLASAPMAISILKCAENWLGHLVSDMGGSKKTAGGGMGIPGVFLSLFYEISSIPGFNKSGLTQYINNLYEKEKLDLRHELPILKILEKQVIPVVLNELLVRCFYFVRHLAEACKGCQSLSEIDWKSVIPVGNRTVERMITVANMTFSVADTTDAVVRSAVESYGNAAVFAGRFASRVNYVGAAAATVSICKEIGAEQKELELLREKRLLAETKSEAAVKLLRAYQEQLAATIDEFLSEDLETYLSGLTDMDKAAEQGDSDRYLRGNLTIQRVLGREFQFEDQCGFDALMASDDAFRL